MLATTNVHGVTKVTIGTIQHFPARENGHKAFYCRDITLTTPDGEYTVSAIGETEESMQILDVTSLNQKARDITETKAG